MFRVFPDRFRADCAAVGLYGPDHSPALSDHLSGDLKKDAEGISCWASGHARRAERIFRGVEIV